MLRGLMYVLLAWPTLMPPGICVCQLQAAIAIAPQSSQNSDEPAACCRKCGRTKCGHPRTTSGDRNRSDDAIPTQQPADHAPGCPANPCFSIRMAPTIEGRVSITDFQLAHVPIDILASPSGLALSSLSRVIDPAPPSSSGDIFLLVCNFRC